MAKALFGTAVMAAGALASAAAPAVAGKATYTMPVSVNVVSGCTVTAAPLVFSMPVPSNATFDSTSVILVRCNPNLPFTIDLDNGLQPQGNNRQVFNAVANAYLRYDIYKDPPRSQVWGRGNTRNLAGNSGPFGLAVYPVYGRLTGRANAPAGGYQDTVTITVNF